MLMPQKMKKPPKDIDYIQVFLDEKSLSVRPTTIKTYTMILGRYRAIYLGLGEKFAMENKDLARSGLFK